jgi:hypothetical protein
MKKSAAKWRMKEISESVMKERRNNNIWKYQWRNG